MHDYRQLNNLVRPARRHVYGDLNRPRLARPQPQPAVPLPAAAAPAPAAVPHDDIDDEAFAVNVERQIAERRRRGSLELPVSDAESFADDVASALVANPTTPTGARARRGLRPSPYSAGNFQVYTKLYSPYRFSISNLSFFQKNYSC